MTDKEIERTRTLIAAFRVEHDKTAAILEELEILLTGGTGIAEKLKEAEGTYSELWAGRYRSAYIWAYQKDRPHTKRLIKLLGVEELKARMARYLQNTDVFFTSRRHPYGLFVSTIVQHARANDQPMAGDLELMPNVYDCRHDPPCKSDQEHTKRRAAEMRGEAF